MKVRSQDILGIMAFYFLISLGESQNEALAVGDFSLSLVITIVTSVILSYLLIYVFQNLETKIKLFLMIAVLFLLFSVGKLMHLSSLLVILIFGLILNNNKNVLLRCIEEVCKTNSLGEIFERHF